MFGRTLLQLPSRSLQQRSRHLLPLAYHWNTSTFRSQAPLASQVNPLAASRHFSSTPIWEAKRKGGRKVKKGPRVFRDAYTLRQIEARRNANIARQVVLKKERAESTGDAIRGRTTPFVESFDTALEQIGIAPSAVAGSDAGARTLTESSSRKPETREDPSNRPLDGLNHFVSRTELEGNIRYSHQLSRPFASAESDPNTVRVAEVQHKIDHNNAEEAVRRIVGLGIGSSRDRTRANTQRCIDTFGRHNTDGKVPRRGLSALQLSGQQPLPRELTRAGPDTGSSEVQIAVLTAKIRVLADAYQGNGRMDKINKRNLRLLLHRRQKLLAYLSRKERGSGRWQHLVDTLGLTAATWKGEIEVR